MKFAITGMGRSGTMFLAHGLDQPGFRVRHEPVEELQTVRTIQERFEHQHPDYGEVNSFLRFAIVALNVDKKLIIVRNPRDIWQSMWNRGASRSQIEHLNESLHVLDAAIQSGIPAVGFHDVVEKPQDVGRIVGVRCDATDFKRCNTSTYRKMPSNVAKHASDTVQWFVDEYESLVTPI